MTRLTLLLCAAACAAGCVAPAPQLDARIGTATREMLARQTLHPAGAPADDAGTLPGAAAANTHDRYIGSFREPAAAPLPFVFGNVGAGR